MVCGPGRHCVWGPFKRGGSSLVTLARRLLLDYPWADALRPVAAHVTTFAGDARLLAKHKIDDLLQFKGVGTAWAAGLVADGLVPLLSHKMPISVAEAVEAGFGDGDLPGPQIGPGPVAAVWGYSTAPSMMAKFLLRGVPWARPPARDTTALPAEVEFGPLYVACIVGSYRHVHACAPLLVRQHCLSPGAARDTLLALPPNLVAVLVAEALVVATEQCHALHHLVSREPWWPAYRTFAFETACNAVRPWLWNTLAGFTGTLKVSWLDLAAKPPLVSVWRPFLKALNLHVKIKPETLEAAGPLAALAATLGSQRVLGAGLVEADLHQLDIDPAIVKQTLTVPAVLVGRTMKAMRARLASLTPAARARLVIYVHARRGSIAETIVFRPQCAAQPDTTMLFCTICKTSRSKFVAARCISKRLHGLEINLRTGAVTCSTCPGTAIREVQVGQLAYQLRYANGTIFTFDSCGNCGVLTSSPHYRDSTGLCRHCQARPTPPLSPCFLCDHPASARFVASTRLGIRWLSVCDRHRPLLPKDSLPSHNQLCDLHGGSP